MSESPVAEVVVCTRNRAQLLAGACEAILQQDYAPALWRLVIVDNASTDDTFAAARELERRYEGRVRAVREPEIGHCAARNAGIRATTAPIIAFTDDDALPDPAWLRTLVASLTDGNALAAGGPVVPVITGEPPKWFLPDFVPYLAIWEPPRGTTELRYNEYPRGVNLAFRREVFERFGFFNTSLGLKEGRPLYCDETEMCLRIERAGERIVYAPHSLVRHCVEAERLTVDWITRRFDAQGRSEAIVQWIHGGLRGVLSGLRLHLGNYPAVHWTVVAKHHGELTIAEVKEAAAILTRCRRLAIRGYLRQIGPAMANVPRYRAPAPIPSHPSSGGIPARRN
jgi:GT2 family glycosyltransferase